MGPLLHRNLSTSLSYLLTCLIQDGRNTALGAYVQRCHLGSASFFSKPAFRIRYLKNIQRKKKGRGLYPIANSGGQKKRRYDVQLTRHQSRYYSSADGGQLSPATTTNPAPLINPYFTKPFSV